MIFLGVALAGAAGAVARYAVDRAVQRRLYTVIPMGTMVVNVSGSFLFGVVTGVAINHGLASTPTTVTGTGFLGSYTTLSTFGLESVRLRQDGALLASVANVVISVVAGLSAAAVGVALGTVVSR